MKLIENKFYEYDSKLCNNGKFLLKFKYLEGIKVICYYTIYNNGVCLFCDFNLRKDLLLLLMYQRY